MYKNRYSDSGKDQIVSFLGVRMDVCLGFSVLI